MSKKPNPLVRFIVHKPWIIISLTIAITIFMGFGMPNIKFDSDLSDDIPDTIPEKAFFDEVGRIFPSDDALFLALRSEQGIWNVPYLSMIKEWSDTVKTLPGVKGVLSLSSAGIITGDSGGISIKEAMPSAPQDQAAVDAIRQSLASSDITKALLSKDGQATILLISLKEGLDTRPVPYFSITVPKDQPLDASTLENLAQLQGKALETIIERVDYDQNQWDQAKVGQRVFLSVVPKAGLDEAASQQALSTWLREKGRASWEISKQDGITRIGVDLNSNEAPETTRRKVADFLAAGALLTAPAAEARMISAVSAILKPDQAADRFTAASTYTVSLQNSDGRLSYLIVPNTDVYLPSLEQALRASLSKADISFKNTGISFYQRIQATLPYLNKAPGTTVYISGAKAVSGLVQGLLVRDLSFLFPVVILIIIVVLWFSFRTLRGVLLPLGNVIIAVIWVVGLMGWIGVPLSQATAVLPIILIAVGTAYTIHPINRYYEELASEADKPKALEQTLRHVAIPVLLAGVTTMIGFGSLVVSALSALQVFGLLSALGILFGLILALTFSIAILAVLKAPKLSMVAKYQDTIYTRGLSKLGKSVVKRPLVYVFSFVAIAIVAGFGLLSVRFETNTLQSFKPDTEIRQASEYLNEQFTGITVLQVIVQVPTEGAILEPKYLQPIDDLQTWLETLREREGTVYAPNSPGYNTADRQIIGGSQSITTFIKGINKALNADDPAFNRIPPPVVTVPISTETYSLSPAKELIEKDNETGEILARYTLDSTPANLQDPSAMALPAEGTYRLSTDGLTALINFPDTLGRIVDLAANKVNDRIDGRVATGQLVFQYENAGKPENIEGFIDNPRKTARVNVFIRTSSSTQISQIQALVQEFIKTNFAPEVKADLTGSSQLTLTILRFLVSSQLSSVLSSILIILVMITLLSRSLIEGIFSLIPLSFSVLFNFGLMGLAGIPIDISTATIASIAIGIGIDYTLHFMERFKALCRNLSPEEAVVQTMKTTGVGIFFNAIAVAGGFAALMFSQVLGNVYMGLLLAIIMLTSSIGAVTILPALLVLIKPKFIRRHLVKAELHDGFSPSNKLDPKNIQR